MIASKRGYSQIVQKLLQHKKLIDDGTTALFLACVLVRKKLLMSYWMQMWILTFALMALAGAL